MRSRFLRVQLAARVVDHVVGLGGEAHDDLTGPLGVTEIDEEVVRRLEVNSGTSDAPTSDRPS